MSDRDRLIELINDCRYMDGHGIDLVEKQADHLLANGVTVQDVTDINVGGKWISVKDRLPEIVETKQAWKNVYRKSNRVLCACKQADGKQFVKEGYMEFFNDNPTPNWKIPGTIHSVTHWMPLPQPPKGE